MNKTKLTIAEVLAVLDRTHCPCIYSCPPIVGTRQLIAYLGSLGYTTQYNTLKWYICHLYRAYGHEHYDNIYSYNRSVTYSAVLVRDVCKIYRAFALGRHRFYLSLVPG